MTETSILIPDESAHRMAFTEVSFLLDIFASTIEELMGGATSSVGRIAGRELARKLPISDVNANRRDVIREVAEHFRTGYDIRVDDKANDNQIEVQFENCAIREVCKTRDIEPGGQLCGLFHYYFDGVVNELVKSPVKSEIHPGIKVCRCEMQIK